MSFSIELLMHFIALMCPQQLLLERFLNRAAEGFQNLFTAVEDHFELCLAKCRTSSQVSCCAKKSMTTHLQIEILYLVKRHEQQQHHIQLPHKFHNLFMTDYELANCH